MSHNLIKLRENARKKIKSTMCYSSDLNNPRKLSPIMGLCFLKLLVDEFLETDNDIGTAQSN